MGVIDESHIHITAEKQSHTEYFSHKGSHSIILPAVVDGRGLQFCFVRTVGSLHYASVSLVGIVGSGGLGFAHA